MLVSLEVINCQARDDTGIRRLAVSASPLDSAAMPSKQELIEAASPGLKNGEGLASDSDPYI